MPLYRWNPDNLETVTPTTFEAEGLREREDLQRLLRDQPEVIEEGLFVVAEEFSNWQDSSRSIDLLGLDVEGNLVVIELKRTQTGDHSELQAIRYAAMIANMTLEQIIEAHRSYLAKRGFEQDARIRVLNHLGVEDNADAIPSTGRPRIILASAGFSTELTTSVLWLRDGGMGITCIKLHLFRSNDELLMETSQVIPLPEAAEYQVQIRRKQEEEQSSRSPGKLVNGGEAFQDEISSASLEYQELLRHLYKWAVNLEEEGLCGLQTFFSRRNGEVILLPRLRRTGSGLASVYNQRTGPRIQFFRSVYDSQAPNSIERIERLTGTRMGQGNWISNVTDELLEALTDAYREANGLPPISPHPGSDPDNPPQAG